MVLASFTALLASVKSARVAVCIAAAMVVLLQARVGAASRRFPRDLRETLQLDCTPTCLLCHKTMDGGYNNLRPYGEWVKTGKLLQQGVDVYFAPDGPASMSNFDMDKEGVSDRDEIIANTDPGTTEPVAICSDAIYGCGASQVAPGATPRTSAWGVAAALGLAVLLLRQLRV